MLRLTFECDHKYDPVAVIHGQSLQKKVIIQNTRKYSRPAYQHVSTKTLPFCITTWNLLRYVVNAINVLLFHFQSNMMMSYGSKCNILMPEMTLSHNDKKSSNNSWTQTVIKVTTKIKSCALCATANIS